MFIYFIQWNANRRCEKTQQYLCGITNNNIIKIQNSGEYPGRSNAILRSLT